MNSIMNTGFSIEQLNKHSTNHFFFFFFFSFSFIAHHHRQEEKNLAQGGKRQREREGRAKERSCSVEGQFHDMIVNEESENAKKEKEEIEDTSIYRSSSIYKKVHDVIVMSLVWWWLASIAL